VLRARQPSIKNTRHKEFYKYLKQVKNETTQALERDIDDANEKTAGPKRAEVNAIYLNLVRT
jgi:hypothetical protein